MFGYVRPVLARLSDDEKSLYQSAYCGLCHAMGKRHGWLSRFTLNYDFAFLAVLLCGSGGDGDSRCMRCPAHPLRKPKACLCGGELERAADESMILTWYKLYDDVDDRSFFPGLPYRFLRRLFRRAYRRAAAAHPQFDLRVKEGMAQLRRLEDARSPQLDRAAHAFADILAAAGECVEDEVRQRTMEQLLYHLGRWIYLVDAWDDLDEDQKKGRYNPLDARFDGQAKQKREYVETTITHSARLVSAAANLMEFGRWDPIVRNVIESGLPAVQRTVLDCQWKQLRKARRNTT